MMFANYVPLCSSKREELQKRLEIWRKTLEERGMKISQKKTEYLCAGGRREQEGNIKLQNTDVPRVNTCKYLSAAVQDNGGEKIEIGRRISAAWHRVEENYRYNMRQKGPKLGKRKNPHHDGATGDALWSGNGSADKETRTEDVKDGNDYTAICTKGNTKDKIRNKVVRKIMKVGSLQNKLREWRLR